jgi:integrase
MKGNVKWQTIEIFKEIKSIGESKYSAKNEARAAGASGSHEISQKTGVYSYRTNDAYREAVTKFANWAKENLRLNDLTRTTSDAVKAYLDARISTGVTHKTFQVDKAALNKFETALNRYSETHNLNRNYDFKLNKTFKSEHKNLQHPDVRAYKAADVNKLLNIEDKAVNLAVRCALGAGLRKSEILKLSEKNLSENKIEIIQSKGGKNRIVGEISDKSLISDIKTFLKENNLSKIGDAISVSKINNEIRKVLGDTGSIHALRHNYAINIVKAFENKGLSHTEAVHYTSSQMGHNRNEIIEGVYSK